MVLSQLHRSQQYNALVLASVLLSYRKFSAWALLGSTRAMATLNTRRVNLQRWPFFFFLWSFTTMGHNHCLVEKLPTAMLPRGSPSDCFQFLGPQRVRIFIQGPHFFYFRLKNALKVRAFTIILVICILKGEFSETHLCNENGTSLCAKWRHILLRFFSHNSSPLYFKKLACFNQS